ncbi:MAG: YbhB/YbcL family Raf kinase inhibitor-like protein [Candidatus Korarchaeota archaeon]|nr:YbhB/YbcL family Raf kinase inhibitor-like protein [Candidatus Korarchaeota archaeon]
MSFTLKSVFANGERIPIKYTCDGEDISPPLSWEGQPEGVVSYVLIVEDPDAPIGTFTHWVMYNIPGKMTSLPEGVPKQKETELGMQGINDFRRVGYGGPCPPPGKPHRYFFKLYALDSTLDLPPGARKRDVIEAMKGHVLAQSQIMGIYGRG